MAVGDGDDPVSGAVLVGFNVVGILALLATGVFLAKGLRTPRAIEAAPTANEEHSDESVNPGDTHPVKGRATGRATFVFGPARCLFGLDRLLGGADWRSTNHARIG